MEVGRAARGRPVDGWRWCDGLVPVETACLAIHQPELKLLPGATRGSVQLPYSHKALPHTYIWPVFKLQFCVKVYYFPQQQQKLSKLFLSFAVSVESINLIFKKLSLLWKGIKKNNKLRQTIQKNCRKVSNTFQESRLNEHLVWAHFKSSFYPNLHIVFYTDFLKHLGEICTVLMDLVIFCSVTSCISTWSEWWWDQIYVYCFGCWHTKINCIITINSKNLKYLEI